MSKVPPNSPDAERAVLGCVITEPDTLVDVTDIINSTDFYSSANRIIFSAVKDLSDKNKQIDLTMIIEELKRSNRIGQVGGEVYVAGLTDAFTSPFNVVGYANIIREKAILRKIIQATQNVACQAYDGPDDVDAFLDKTQSEILDINIGNRHNKTDFRDCLTMAMLELEKFEREGVVGMPTGLSDLDHKCHGLGNAELIIIAGRPSEGKTAFALWIAMNAVFELDKTVGIFSVEMSGIELGKRMLCSRSGVSPQNVSGNWDRIRDAQDELWSRQDKILIDDSAIISPGEIRARSRRWAKNHNLALIIVDYLQLLSNPIRGQNREREIADASRRMKGLSKELDCPVILISQLNRATEQRAGGEPRLSDLRESGAIEQDADKVLFLYQDAGDNYIKLAKHRNGPRGRVAVNFQAETGRFFQIGDV